MHLAHCVLIVLQKLVATLWASCKELTQNFGRIIVVDSVVAVVAT